VSTLEARAGVTVAEPGSSETHALSGLGFRPRAVIAWWTCQAEHGVAAGNRGGLGFWASNSTVAVGWSSEDGVPEAHASQVTADAALVGLSADSSTLALEGRLASFDADGLTIAWTVAPTETWIIHFLALGGDALVDARAGWTSVDAGTTDTVLGDLDAAGSLVLVAPALASSEGAMQDGAIVGLGAQTTSGRAACAYSVSSGDAPGAVTGAQRHDALITIPQADGTTCSGSLERDPGGSVRIGWSRRPAQAHRLCHLTLEGIRAHVGVALSPTEPGKRRSRIGFRPDAILFLSWGLGEAMETKRIGRVCIGAASAGDVVVCGGWDDRNTTEPRTATHVVSSTDRVLIVTDTSRGGIHATASVRDIGRTGFRLDWADSDGKTREVLFVALGTRASPSSGALRRVVTRLLGVRRLRGRRAA
jgi:hypothetical protein